MTDERPPGALADLDAITSAIDAGARERRRQARRRALLSLVFPTVVTLGWVVVVTSQGWWPRVLGRWPAPATMLLGSFVGGATPQGSGAVAFPVFTKALEVPAEVARSMSLSIQSFGMTAGAIGLLVRRIPIAWREVAIGGLPAVAGLAIGILVLSDGSLPFRPAILPGAYVKALFTVVVVAMAVVVFIGYRTPLRERRSSLGTPSPRAVGALIAAGLLGGIISALSGSGADVALFIILVIMLGLDARLGVPTAVVIMAMLSVLGLISLGILDGHLDVALSEDRASVVAVAGEPVTIQDGALGFGADGTLAPALRHDLFGLWLAAIPVAVWAGLAGAWVASRLTDRALALFVLILALVELSTTIVFLEELREDRLLAFTFTACLIAGVGVLWWLARIRHRAFDLPPLDHERPITRSSLDVTPAFGEILGVETTPGTAERDRPGTPTEGDPPDEHEEPSEDP